MKATIYLTYNDDTEICFTFECEEKKVYALATLMMVCRGTLMACSAKQITAYDEEGFDILSYTR